MEKIQVEGCKNPVDDEWTQMDDLRRLVKAGKTMDKEGSDLGKKQKRSVLWKKELR